MSLRLLANKSGNRFSLTEIDIELHLVRGWGALPALSHLRSDSGNGGKWRETGCGGTD
jgi:hypothetical protein